MKTIKNKVKIIPTPVSGLALGLASLFWCFENVISQTSYFSGWMQSIGAIIGFILIMPLLIKFVLHPSILIADLKHPVVGSVVPTLAMSLMVISKSIGKLSPALEEVVWFIAVLMHIIFFFVFCYYRYKDFNLAHMIPSWFVPPVGIIVANVAFPDNLMFYTLANVILHFGMIAYAIMLPIMIYRFVFAEHIHDGMKPTIAIFAAPASLSLAGYLTFITEPDIIIVAILLPIAVLMTLIVYISFFRLLRLPFSPGYAAFTFPLAIGATALFKSVNYGIVNQWHLAIIHLIHGLAIFELIAATIIIVYVLICYIKHYRELGLIF